MTTENVAILFTDIVGSTELSQRLSAEDADLVRREHFSTLRQAIAESGGTEVKNLGDGVMVVFSSASAALACAVAMQQGIDRDNRTQGRALGLRIGLSGGEASFEGGDYFGDPVVEAARLCARSNGGQILAADIIRLTAGRRNRHECRQLGQLHLKGLPDPVESVEVLWVPLDESQIAVTIPMPGRLAVRPTVGVIGREAELGLIKDATKRVISGGGCDVLLISGEAGQGKTTLVAEAARTAFESGACVLFGHCEEDFVRPYQLFTESLGHFITHATELELTAAVKGNGSGLIRLVPALASRIPNPSPSKATDTESERLLLFASVVDLLTSVSERQPVVLVLDDLQWADNGSLLLLRHLASAEAELRVLILGTYRDSELSCSHPFTETLAALHRQGVSCIELSGLDGNGVVLLLEGAAGQALDDAGIRLAHALHRETDGNPFFVSEILRHLSDTGVIYQDPSGQWTAEASVTHMALPDSIRVVIGARIGRLGLLAEQVLSMAAVIGRDFDLDLLAESTKTHEDELLTILDAASAASLVRELLDPPGRYCFEHALIQHTLYQDLGATRQARAHRTVAVSLEAICLSGNERVGEIAHHWFLSASGDRIRGLDYAEQAANEALMSLAYEDAAEWLDRAVQVVDRDTDSQTYARLQLGLAEVATRAGQQDRARRAAEAAWRVAREQGESATEANAALLYAGEPELNVVGDEPGIQMLEETLVDLRAADANRARVMARLGSAISYTNHSRATTLGTEALALARQIGDNSTIGFALRCRLRGWFDPDEVPARRAAASELRSLGSHLQDPFLEAWGIRWQSSIFEDGDLNLIEQAVNDLSTIARSLNSPNHRWAAAVRRAALMIHLGRFDEAERLQRSAGEETARLDNLLVHSVLEAQRELLALLTGPSVPGVIGPGSIDLYGTRFEQMIKDPVSWLGPDITRLATITAAATHVAIEPNHALAVAIYPWAYRYRDLISSWNPGVAMLGSMHLYAGLLAMGKEDEEVAIDHLRRAIRRNSQLGARPFHALSLHYLAAALGDTREAEDARGQSTAIENSVGIPWLSS